MEGISKKIIVFLKSVISLVVFFGILAYINEHFTKPMLKLPRPSHEYMLKETGRSVEIDSLYDLSRKERKYYFTQLLREHSRNFHNIDNKVQLHWLDESGYSFPSGHTFNAFLFAMILAYAVYFNRNMPRFRWWFLLGFVWATAVGVSRVAIGAHSALDVSAGALLGILIGALFLYIDITRHWLIRK